MHSSPTLRARCSVISLTLTLLLKRARFNSILWSRYNGYCVGGTRASCWRAWTNTRRRLTSVGKFSKVENLPISASEWGAEQGAKFRGVPLGNWGDHIMKEAMVLIVSAMWPEPGARTTAPPLPSQSCLEHCQASQISGICCVYTSLWRCYKNSTPQQCY